MATVEKLAESTNYTFWSHIKQLKQYKEEQGISIVKDRNGIEVEVLFVSSGIRKKGQRIYMNLYRWLCEQNNYQPSSDGYAVQAWRNQGSLEYMALVELNVSFDDYINGKAYNMNIKKGVDRKKQGRNSFGAGIVDDLAL